MDGNPHELKTHQGSASQYLLNLVLGVSQTKLSGPPEAPGGDQNETNLGARNQAQNSVRKKEQEILARTVRAKLARPIF